MSFGDGASDPIGSRASVGSMRLLPETEEQLAVAILNALDEAGFKIVKRGEQPIS